MVDPITAKAEIAKWPDILDVQLRSNRPSSVLSQMTVSVLPAKTREQLPFLKRKFCEQKHPFPTRYPSRYIKISCGYKVIAARYQKSIPSGFEPMTFGRNNPRPTSSRIAVCVEFEPRKEPMAERVTLDPTLLRRGCPHSSSAFCTSRNDTFKISLVAFLLAPLSRCCPSCTGLEVCGERSLWRTRTPGYRRVPDARPDV